MPVQPIKPSQVVKKKHETIPDAVIEAFNELIVKHCSESGHACFQQKEVVALAVAKLRVATGDDSITAQTLYNNKWLDVEGIYRKAGWKVEYDSPAYCESYEASFTFQKSKS